MPFSSTAFDESVLEFLRKTPIQRFLDIGAGAGKYGRMVKGLNPDTDSTAVEIDPTYLTVYGLADIYNSVYCSGAIKLLDTHVDVSYDLVIVGDCIEHMRKSEGIDLLNFLVYRCQHLLVIFPEKFLQGSWEGHRAEAHISVWGETDFTLFDHAFERRGQICMATIRGYLT